MCEVTIKLAGCLTERDAIKTPSGKIAVVTGVQVLHFQKKPWKMYEVRLQNHVPVLFPFLQPVVSMRAR